VKEKEKVHDYMQGRSDELVDDEYMRAEKLEIVVDEDLDYNEKEFEVEWVEQSPATNR
jgi:hypothetical protein